MQKRSQRIVIYSVIFVVFTFFLISGAPLVSAADLPGKGISVQPCYNGIAEEYFQLLIVNKGLEKLGYKVKKPYELEITAMHVAVGNGDADYNANHWRPLHDSFFEKVGGSEKVSRVGTLIEGAVQGYLIDKKTADKYKIETINQLKDPKLAQIFDIDDDGKADLTGCNPGWGCERVIEHHLDAYGLRDRINHNQGSYFALIADTIARYKAGKPILYYTWSPQWVGGVLVPGKDVKWLTVTHTDLPEDQKDAKTTLPDGRNVGFSVNSIHVFANNQFLAKNPAAKRFFERAKIPIEDIGVQNFKMREGEKRMRDIERHADEWIAAHQAAFDSWVQEAMKTSK